MPPQYTLTVDMDNRKVMLEGSGRREVIDLSISTSSAIAIKVDHFRLQCVSRGHDIKLQYQTIP